MLIRDWGLDSLVILKGDCNDFIVVFPGIPHLDSNCDSWTKLVQLFIAQPWQQMIFDSPNPVVRDPEELKGHHFDSNKSYVQLFAQRTWSTEIPWAFSIFTTNNLLYNFFNRLFYSNICSSRYIFPHQLRRFLAHFLHGTLSKSSETNTSSDRCKISSAARYDRPCAMKLSFSFSKKAHFCVRKWWVLEYFC